MKKINKTVILEFPCEGTNEREEYTFLPSTNGNVLVELYHCLAGAGQLGATEEYTLSSEEAEALYLDLVGQGYKPC